MPYNLPAHGETNYDTKLNASIDFVKATADAAETPAGAQAKADAAKAFAIQRANHTGTQTLATISDAGTAAAANTGTTSGTIPLLSTGGVLPIARLATGTPDGTKFIADDGTLKTPTGSTPIPDFPLGMPYFATTLTLQNLAGGLNPGIGVEYAVQVNVTSSITIDGFATRLWIGGASLVCRAGIYADAGQIPSTTVSNDLGTVACAAGGWQIQVLGSTVTLPPGTYWFSLVQQGANPDQWLKSCGVRHPMSSKNDPTAPGANLSLIAYSRTGSTGALSGNSAAWTPVYGANVIGGSPEGDVPTLHLRRSA